MKILTNAIVSNSEMIRNYKSCREKAEELGKIFIMRNNQLDAILFSFEEYERLSGIIEYLESIEETEFIKVLESLPKKADRKKYNIQNMRTETD